MEKTLLNHEIRCAIHVNQDEAGPKCPKQPGLAIAIAMRALYMMFHLLSLINRNINIVALNRKEIGRIDIVTSRAIL